MVKKITDKLIQRHVYFSVIFSTYLWLSNGMHEEHLALILI